MASFDPQEQRLCVRVVYDGVASAGKTTNLRQLARLFGAERGVEVYSPQESGGRTLFFDWMEIRAGAVAGVPLLCQVITVPGQVVLTPRRRHLLASADVIVHVCDSSVAGVERTREALAVADQVLRTHGRTVPTIVQANKQDQADALAWPRLVRALGIAGPAVEAIATQGIGVVDTFVTAIRAFARTLPNEMPDLQIRSAETREQTLRQVESEAIHADWADEMFVEEAQELLAQHARSKEGAPHARPTLPSPDVPTGLIWPAVRGRAMLRSLAKTGALSVGPEAVPNGGVVHAACGFAMRTHQNLRFENADEARRALVRAARERTQLEGLLAPETAVVAQPAADGALWLWTVMPELVSVASFVRDHGGDSAVVGTVLEAYGDALGRAVRLMVEHGFDLELGTETFAVEEGVVRYTGDVGLHASIVSPGARAEKAIAELAPLGAAAAKATLAFERAVSNGRVGAP